ncbi:MAG: hypothetical protein DSY66_02685 [Persephonella sp.]|nr:MAG: hypothetical protein DSY53_01250 [Persephonella sp.]RUM61239.1 MAG: hypothetical protein DSY66_02685 [Persephonella sp.]
MIKRFLIKIFFLLILSLPLTSCLNTLQLLPEQTPIELIPKNKVMGKFSFVIPDNFRFVSDQSLIYDYRGDVRAYLVYVGKASTVQIINFLTEYMPEKGWKPDFATVSTDGVLAFKKGDRLIVFKITPDMAGIVYLKILLTK